MSSKYIAPEGDRVSLRFYPAITHKHFIDLQKVRTSCPKGQSNRRKARRTRPQIKEQLSTASSLT